MKGKYREILNLLSDYGISEAVTLNMLKNGTELYDSFRNQNLQVISVGMSFYIKTDANSEQSSREAAVMKVYILNGPGAGHVCYRIFRRGRYFSSQNEYDKILETEDRVPAGARKYALSSDDVENGMNIYDSLNDRTVYVVSFNKASRNIYYYYCWSDKRSGGSLSGMMQFKEGFLFGSRQEFESALSEANTSVKPGVKAKQYYKESTEADKNLPSGPEVTISFGESKPPCE